MGTMASQITSLAIVYSTLDSGADQSKHQSSASMAFVWGIHRSPVNSPHKWPVTRKKFPFHDVIMHNTQLASQNTNERGALFSSDFGLPCTFVFEAWRCIYAPVTVVIIGSGNGLVLDRHQAIIPKPLLTLFDPQENNSMKFQWCTKLFRENALWMSY